MKLVPRSTTPRCALCHGALRSAVLTCVACRTLIHEACELDRCPTLGCGSLVPWVLVARVAPPRAWRGAAALGVASALVVAALATPAATRARPVEAGPDPTPEVAQEEPVAPTTPPAPAAAPSARPDEDWRLEGVVLDERGAPLAGANVDLWQTHAWDPAPPPRGRSTCTTTTDGRGRYRFRAPFCTGEHRTVARWERGHVLVASAPGRVRDLVLVDALACRSSARVELHPLQLRPEALEAAPVQRSLRVVQGGAPVVGARVGTWLPGSGSWAQQARTDRDGLCALRLPAGGQRIEVRLEGWSQTLSCVAQVASEGVTTLEVPSTDTWTRWISGRTNLADAEAARWRSSARIVFESFDGRLSIVADEGASGFQLAVPVDAQGVVLARPQYGVSTCGYSGPPRAAPDARAPAAAGDSELRLVVASGTLDGRVVGPTGFRVAYARVQARVATGAAVEVTADQLGWFSLTHLPPGPVQLAVTRHLLSGVATVEITGDAQEVVVTVR